MARPVDPRLLRESGTARRQLIVVGALGVAETGLIVAQAVLLGTLIAQAAEHGIALQSVRGQLVALAAVIGARALVHAGYTLSGRLGASGVMSDLRRRLFSRVLLDAPGVAGAQQRTGDLATVAVGGVDALEAWFAGYLPALVLAGLAPLAVLVWAVRLDPIAAVILAATVPILIGFMILVGLGARARARKRQGALSLLSAHFLDVVSGLETLRCYRREAAQRVTLDTVGERYRRETMGTLRMAFMSALVLELCAMLGTALVAATIGVQLCNGDLSLAAGLTVLLLAPELYGPLREVGQQFHAGADATAAAERIFAVLDGAHAPATGAAAAPDPRHEPVRLQAVTRRYAPDGPAVLDGVDLELPPGTTTLLRGRSGAGKSTLTRLVLGLESPTTGRVLCGPADLAGLAREAWHARLAWVPQRPVLLAATVLENLRVGAPGATEAQAWAALEAMGAAGFVAALAGGLNAPIGDGGRRLSAGQRQRIALARAHLRDASLIVLDEPTAHLDPGTAAALVPALRRLVAGRTALLVVHDDTLDTLADRTVLLEHGVATAWLADRLELAA
ncbi:MAG TPA: thiol reductant ABC exporter subunit CydD [Solirubrobacteraceae bacterium]|nr:thiol reductant ABC exporter subunit CydD [Solirubrobacteraceae bacterium]